MTRFSITTAPRLVALCFAVAVLSALFWGHEESLAQSGSDQLECSVEGDELYCSVDIRPFLTDEIQDALSSGWENEIHMRLFILDEDEDIVGLTYVKLNQRCYLDFFEETCLALWDGADEWESYNDLDALIKGVGSIRLRSVQTSSLEPGDHRARLVVELNPLTNEQISQVRSWLARNRGGHLVMDQSDSSIFGTFVSIFANVRPGDAEASLTVDAHAIAIQD